MRLCKLIGHRWRVVWSPVRYECIRCGAWRLRGTSTHKGGRHGA